MQQQQAFEPGTQNSMFGIFGLGPGSPGPMGGVLNPPPVHAFTAPLDQPAASWAGFPPGISVVPTTGFQPTGAATSTTMNAAVPTPSLLMPPQMRIEATTFQGATAAAIAAATAQAHAPPGGMQNFAQNSGPFGPPNVPRQKELGPSLTQQRAAAAKMGGIAPKPAVQEARPSGQFKAGPRISMQEEYASAESMQEAHQARQEQEYEPPSLQVLPPAAWRRHVPDMHEPPFAFEPESGAQRPDALPNALPVHKAAPLAEYTLSSPAPAGSTILQLVSQS